MALGGGTFTSYDKRMPGAYINFVSGPKSQSVVLERGIVAVALELDWGEENDIIRISADTIENTEQSSGLYTIGYPYTSEFVKPLREIFKSSEQVLLYRLNGGGEKATCAYATAKYSGIRGNAIQIVVQKSIDNDEIYEVATYMDSTRIDMQQVTKASELEDNNLVVFNKESDLELTAGTNLTGGTNGTTTGASQQEFLKKLENKYFNVLVTASTDTEVQRLYAAFTKRMRDSLGKKFQTVLFNYAGDYEGIVNVVNKVSDDELEESNIVYWVAGVQAGVALESTAENIIYDGELDIICDQTQEELADGADAGKFLFHMTDDEVRVFKDVNSLVNLSVNKNTEFQSNKVIRVIDSIAIEIMNVFNTTYIASDNTEDTRNALREDIVEIVNEKLATGAIASFDENTLTIQQGTDRESVIVEMEIGVSNLLRKLYLTCVVAQN